MSALLIEALKDTHRRAQAFLDELNQAPWPDRERWSQRLQPEHADWARIFLPTFEEPARRAYAPFWKESPVPERGHGEQTQVVIAGVIPAGMFSTDNGASRQHPGGFQRVAAALQPDVHWVSWKLVEPGHSSGMSHNGLVRLDDHFVWCPKPWRALSGGF